MIIEVQNVTKLIGDRVILDNVNVSLESGRIYGLEGANGSGKTMLLRLLCGLMTPTKGVVLYDGKELKKGEFPDSVGLLLENPGFLDQYTGLKNLELLAEIRQQIDKTIIREMIQRVGLNPEDKRKYGKYSLGMKQRLGIACALMESPEIVLLDEPTNALDAEGIQEVKGLILSEKKREALIVVASHDASFIQEIADSVMGVENGRVFIKRT